MKRKVYRSAAALVCALAGPAWSQQSDNGAIDEIVVTAQRREQNLQDVPIAITAFSERLLQERAVLTVADIQRYTPGLNIAAGRGTSSDAFIFIRGIGQNDDFFVADPAVGIYIDGVYSSRTQGSLLTFQDVERVEVLRGPQGTLYGKNTVSGAINITSKAPDLDAADYRFDIAGGSYRQFDVQGSVSVPLDPGTAALRVSALYSSNNGYFRNEARDERTNNRDIFGARVALLLAPADALTITLRGDLTWDRSKARLGQIVGFNPNEAFVANINRIYAPQRLQDFVLQPGDDAFIGGSDLAPRADIDIYGLSGTIQYDFGGATLKSITAGRWLYQNTNLDIDNSPLFAVNSIRDLEHRQFSQEVTLTGTALDSRLNWLAGVFWFTERGTLLNDLPIVLGAVVTPRGPLDISNRRDAGAETDSIAGFSQLEYALTDRLSIKLGGRFTRETKRLRLRTSNPNTGNVTFDSNGFRSESWDSFDPRVAVEFKPIEDVLLYASASTGFKSGGFNARAAVGGQLEAFDPETARSYEAGVKTDLFDRRLRLNLAAFWLDYRDLQLTVFRTVNNAISQAVRNAGKATIKGLEVEAQLRPADGLDLFASSAYTNARYDEFIDLIGGVPVDKSGNRFVNTPEFQLTLGGQYSFDLADGRFSVGGDWAWQSTTWKEVDNDPSLVQPGYGVTNARIAWSTADDRVTIAAVARNLFDVRYLNMGAQISSFGAKVGWFGDPQTFALQLTLR